MTPLRTVHIFWLAGMSCDGCSLSIAGAADPAFGDLLAGTILPAPKLILHHPLLSAESGERFLEPFENAASHRLGETFIVVYEGSVADERIADRTGGGFCTMGSVPTATWLRRLAPGAALTIAVGTCAAWGGVPAAAGNPTGALGVMDVLGEDYRSAFGLPVINIPGCAPIGDNFTDTLVAILRFTQGLGPLPMSDQLGRPAWLFGDTPEQLVAIGRWGPLVKCNMTERGAVNHVGGCVQAGGRCIGCTMPGFPDKFALFDMPAVRAAASSSASPIMDVFVRPLRRWINADVDRSPQWDRAGRVPSGWGHVE